MEIWTKHPCTAILLLLTFNVAQAVPNPNNGGHIAGVCRFCHGMLGQGTSSMLAPRLAGLPEWYLNKAIGDFRRHVRIDPLMMRTTGLDRMTAQDIEDVSAFLASMDISQDARFNIVANDGSSESGKAIFQDDCKNCHGRDGFGKERKGAPPLAGQQHEYLRATIALFKSKRRHHDNDPDDETFSGYSSEQISDLIAYIATLDNARIRPGFRFTPPSVRPVTADAEPRDTAFGEDTMQTVDIRQTLAKMPVAESVTPQEAILAMKSRAYELNLRVVGEQYISREHASRGIRSRYLTVLQFCSPSESYVLIEANPIFAGYMPCRIALVEDAQHKLWLIMFNMDVVLDSDLLPPHVVEAAVNINRNLLSIMASGATGDF